MEVKFIQKKVKVENLNESQKGNQTKQTGTVIVNSRPIGAKITLSGKTGIANCRFSDVPTGDCSVKASFPSKDALNMTFDLPPNEEITIIADFFKNEISADIKYKLSINCNVKANIYIDSKFIDKAPSNITLNQGKYKIKLTKPGYEAYNKSINLSSNDFIDVSLIPKRRTAILSIPLDNLSGVETVKINEVKIGKTPVRDYEVDLGTNNNPIEKINISVGLYEHDIDIDDGQSYELICKNKIPKIKIDRDAFLYSDKHIENIPYPKLLPTSKKKVKFTDSMTFGALLGFSTFGSLGLVIDNQLVKQKKSSKGLALGISSAVGVAYGILAVAENHRKFSKHYVEVPLNRNIEKNKVIVENWKKKRKEIEATNQDLYNSYENEIQSRNKGIDFNNKNRGYWILKNLNELFSGNSQKIYPKKK